MPPKRKAAAQETVVETVDTKVSAAPPKPEQSPKPLKTVTRPDGRVITQY